MFAFPYPFTFENPNSTDDFHAIPLYKNVTFYFFLSPRECHTVSKYNVKNSQEHL